MASFNDRIIFFVEGVVKNFDKLDTARKSVEKMALTTNQFGEVLRNGSEVSEAVAQDISKQWTRAYDSFSGVMQMTNDEFKDAINKVGEFNSRGGKFAARIREMTVGTKGFRSEFLTLMFVGMAWYNLSRAMLTPAAQLVSIQELWGTTLELLFLPIMILLLPLMVKLLNYVNDMPDSMKLAIGVFVLMIGVLGKLFMWFGMGAMGVAAFIQTAGGLAAVKATMAKWTWGAFALGLGKVLLIAGAIWLTIKAISYLKNSLSSLEESAGDNAKAVQSLREGWEFFKQKTLLEPLINGLSGTKLKIENLTETQIAWGAIVNSTLAYAIIGFGGFGAMIRSLFNSLTFLLSSFVAGFLTMVKKVLEASSWIAEALGFDGAAKKIKGWVSSVEGEITKFTDGMTQDVNDINDAWSKQIELTDKLQNAIISPTKAIENYRKELDKTQKSQEFIKDLMTPAGTGFMTPISKGGLLNTPISSFATKPQTIQDITIDLDFDIDFNGSGFNRNEMEQFQRDWIEKAKKELAKELKSMGI